MGPVLLNTKSNPTHLKPIDFSFEPTLWIPMTIFLKKVYTNYNNIGWKSINASVNMKLILTWLTYVAEYKHNIWFLGTKN